MKKKYIFSDNKFPEIKIRRAGIDRVKEITELFTSTIQSVNSKDYDPVQIDVWSTVSDMSVWRKRISEQYFITADQNGVIVGFASLSIEGLVDLFFVHKDHQRKKIGALLMNEIERYAGVLNIRRLFAEVSITARPFFEAKGFILVKVFVKVHKGTEFIDNLMEKYL